MNSNNEMKQTGKSEPSFVFKAFKGFAAYILKHRLKETAALNLELAYQHKLPLLKQLSHLSESELFALSLKGIEDFYRQVLDDSAMQKALKELEDWKNDTMEGISREKIKLEDLVLGYSIQRQLSLRYLPEYTEDCQELILIIQELENYYSKLQQHALHTFIYIQQEELHQKNQFLSSVINNSLDGILAFDKQMHITEWNPALEKSLGISKEAILGLPLTEVFPAPENAPIIQAFKMALQGQHINYPNATFPSSKGYYEANATPLFDEKNSISGGLGLVHDITHRIETEERLKEHQEELQAANEELTEQQEELQAANEELTEQQEELQAANEELTQQREEIQTLNGELSDNLTQLEEAQETLQQTVTQLREAQAIAHLGSFEFFVANQQVVWSEEMKRIFGISPEKTDIHYEHYLKFLHPEDRRQVETTIEQALTQGKDYSLDHRIIREDGTIRWLHSNGKAEKMNGKVFKLHGTALDITEQKLAQLKVEEEQFFIQKIAETSPDIITVFDLKKNTNIFANRELNVMLGYSEQEFQQLRADKNFIQKLVHPDDLNSGLEFLREFTHYRADIPKEIEYRIKKKSGDYIWVNARYNVFRRSEEGLPTQLISITRNIHTRKLAEEEIKKVNAKLEDKVLRRTAELQKKNNDLTRINSDLDNFVYTASHDLKVPIVNLEGLLILLNKKLLDKLNEKDQQLLMMMQTSIERFKNTIQDLTDLTRLQKDLDEDQLDLISLPELIDDVKSDISGLIEESKAKIELDLGVKEISFDRKNLRSILYNLITNAIKYGCSERPPLVKIKAAPTSGGMVLSIQDNGEGIPQNQQEKIFSLFKRLNKNKEGSGMGLYIVKRIIDNNGGRIEVESKVGSGTTFKIYLQHS